MNQSKQTEDEAINRQFKDGLLVAHNARVEKIERQPYLPFDLEPCTSGRWRD